MSDKIKILFPTDFSDLAGAAFSTAVHVAKAYSADIYVLYVLEAPTGPMKLLSGFDEEAARKEASKMMDHFISVNGDEAVNCEKLIKIGKPYKAIVRAANELHANAIVMGTHGASGAKEVFVGSNAARVIRTAGCPVITTRGITIDKGLRKILLPVDLTKETGEKLKLGIEFAQKFSSSLVILSILESKGEEAKARLEKRMNQAVALVQKAGVEVDSTMISSKENIADLVVEYAEEVDADLIVIMTQQELDFKQTFIGSNASHVVNHSKIPVMSLKPRKEYKTRVYSDSHFG